jgi:uncharacterized FlaG/YvyC family protein
MAYPKIVPIDAVGSSSGIGTVAPVASDLFPGRPVRVEASSSSGKSQAHTEGRQSQKPVEAILPGRSQTPGPTGLVESYVKIRFDENSHTLLIQVINATNDEVIREIPPENWVKMRENIALPKGMLIEKEQ